MKAKGSIFYLATIYGIVVTSLMLLIFGSKLAGSLLKDFIGESKEIMNALFDWYDDPTGFFLAYLIGYAVVVWKPFWGSLIILLASIFVTVINRDNLGFLIFAIPAFLVGVFYILYWIESKKINMS
jgi:hypothetical protein